MLEHYQIHMRKLADVILRFKKNICRRHRMIFFTSSLIKQLYHFATDFERVLLQLVGTDIDNSLIEHRVS